LADFLAVAKYLVKPHGRIAFIHHPSRLAELFVAAAALKLAPLRLRLVHDTTGAAARMVLLEFAKGRTGTLAVLEPLLVRSPDGEYGAEVVQIMRGCDAC
jgi:tRNA1Val (adenine37-N6)-methyltransferase